MLRLAPSHLTRLLFQIDEVLFSLVFNSVRLKGKGLHTFALLFNWLSWNTEIPILYIRARVIYSDYNNYYANNICFAASEYERRYQSGWNLCESFS